MKRSTTFKDPSKIFLSKKNTWEAFNDLPTPELKKLIRPNIVKMDQDAVKCIMNKIQNEQYNDMMHEMSMQENRQNLRIKVRIIQNQNFC